MESLFGKRLDRLTPTTYTELFFSQFMKNYDEREQKPTRVICNTGTDIQQSEKKHHKVKSRRKMARKSRRRNRR